VKEQVCLIDTLQWGFLVRNDFLELNTWEETPIEDGLNN